MNEFLQWYVIIALFWCVGYLYDISVRGVTRKPKEFLWALVWPVPPILLLLVFGLLPLAYLWDQAPALWKRKQP